MPALSGSGDVAFLLTITLLSATAVDPPVFLDHGLKAGGSGCVDLDAKCAVWASQGECQTNAAWMMSNCRRSCQSCQGGDNAWHLRAHIARNYDNNSAAQNFSINTVYVDSLRLDHVEMTWNDSRVMWDREKWNTAWLNFYWVQLWTPKLVQTNSPNAEPGKVEGKVLAANYTGQVYMWSDFSFTANCQFDYSDYPADKQRCCFKLDDKRYFAVRFKVLDMAKDTAQRSIATTHMVGWKLLSADVMENKYTVKVLADWQRNPYGLETTNCDICLSLRRQAAYYSVESVLPLVATVAVTLSSFVLGSFWNQILLLLASLALQLVTMLVVHARLPPVTGDHAPAVAKFCGFNLIITTILLVISCLLMNLASWTSNLPPPHVVDQFLSLLESLLPCYRPEAEEKLGDPTLSSNGVDAGSAEPTKKHRRHWSPFCTAIKHILFALCSTLYAIVIFFTFCL